MDHMLEREIAQWIHHVGLIRRPIAPWTDAVSRSYISLIVCNEVTLYGIIVTLESRDLLELIYKHGPWDQ